MSELERAERESPHSLPMPTAEEILEDLRNAPQTDVVFAAPPVEPKTANTKGLLAGSHSEEADRVVKDSIHFVRAYQRLDEDGNILPNIVRELEQCINELKTEISISSAR